MKITEIKSKTVDELKDLLINFRKEAFNLRFQKTNGQLTNTSRVKYVRRSIAKIKTIMNERKHAGELHA